MPTLVTVVTGVFLAWFGVRAKDASRTARLKRLELALELFASLRREGALDDALSSDAKMRLQDEFWLLLPGRPRSRFPLPRKLRLRRRVMTIGFAISFSIASMAAIFGLVSLFFALSRASGAAQPSTVSVVLFTFGVCMLYFFALTSLGDAMVSWIVRREQVKEAGDAHTL